MTGIVILRIATTPAMSKPTEKYMQTQWGKTVALHEGDIEFDTQVINITMDEESIHVFSNNNILIETLTTTNIGTTTELIP